jgi:hypothetical protein
MVPAVVPLHLASIGLGTAALGIMEASASASR